MCNNEKQHFGFAAGKMSSKPCLQNAGEKNALTNKKLQNKHSLFRGPADVSHKSNGMPEQRPLLPGRVSVIDPVVLF